MASKKRTRIARGEGIKSAPTPKIRKKELNTSNARTIFDIDGTITHIVKTFKNKTNIKSKFFKDSLIDYLYKDNYSSPYIYNEWICNGNKNNVKNNINHWSITCSNY